MSTAARLNSRITQLAVGRHLPHRTVRVRLTLLYGGLFLLSGAALMAITYGLLVQAGFVFALQNGVSMGTGPPRRLAVDSWAASPTPDRRRTRQHRRWPTGAALPSASASTASPSFPTRRPRSRRTSAISAR